MHASLLSNSTLILHSLYIRTIIKNSEIMPRVKLAEPRTESTDMSRMDRYQSDARDMGLLPESVKKVREGSDGLKQYSFIFPNGVGVKVAQVTYGTLSDGKMRFDVSVFERNTLFSASNESEESGYTRSFLKVGEVNASLAALRMLPDPNIDSVRRIMDAVSAPRRQNYVTEDYIDTGMAGGNGVLITEILGNRAIEKVLRGL